MSSSGEGEGEPVDRRPRVTVLSGFRRETTASVVRALSAARPSTRVVQHDVAELAEGRVRRLVSTADEILEFETVELAHGCLSCTIREDVLPTVARLAADGADILLALPPVVEPESLAMAAAIAEIPGLASGAANAEIHQADGGQDRPLTDLVNFGAFVTVVDAGTFTDDLLSEDDLADRGLATMAIDDRTVAGVVVRQVEYADVVLVGSEEESLADEDRARLIELVRGLTPRAAVLAPNIGRDTEWVTNVLDGIEHDLTQPPVLLRGIEGYPVAADDTDSAGAIRQVRFTARRPLHPERFETVLGRLLELSVRGRGHLWLATQPETVVAYESAGHGVSMGSAGRWLAAADDADWADVSPGRRTAAALDWHPEFGDRSIDLVFVLPAYDVEDLRAALNHCLVTDTEISEGFDGWLSWRDPFAGCFETHSEPVS